MMMDRKHCLGCKQDFYNDKNPYGIKTCWNLKDAKVITRYAIGTWMPTVKGSFTKVKKPSCYEQKGTHYYNALPEHCR